MADAAFGFIFAQMAEKPESSRVFWQFKSRESAQEMRIAVHDGKVFCLGWDADGHPSFYEIREGEAGSAAIPKLDLDAESSFIPAAFSGLKALPWVEAGALQEKPMDNLILVTAFPSAPETVHIPLAEVLYHIAKERATHAGTQNYSLVMLLDEQVHVMIFNGAQLAYYQKHHAENEHAVLYFLVAALRDLGIPVEDAVCELLLNSPDDFKAYRNFTSYFRFFGAFSYDGIRALVGESLPPDPLLLYLLAKTPACGS
jgi:hypothetical protein